MDASLPSEIQRRASLTSTTPSHLESLLTTYCKEHQVPEDWRRNAFNLLGVPREEAAPKGKRR